MRLFRQTTRGDWKPVVERVAEALRQRIDNAQDVAPVSAETANSRERKIGPLTPEWTTLRSTPSALSAVTEARVGLLQFFPSTEPMGPSIELYGEYLQAQIALLARLVRPGDIVLEAGADIGIHTLMLSKGVTESGSVMAYEVRAPIARALRHNLSANGSGNVTVVDRALGRALVVDGGNQG